MESLEGEYICVDKDLPLISNLNMIENIAILLEIHQRKTSKEAHQVVQQLLNTLSLENIGNKRQNFCTQLEIFYVMLLRAVVYGSQYIVINYFFNIVEEIDNIEQVLEALDKIATEKKVIFIDTKNNQHLYGSIPIISQRLS